MHSFRKVSPRISAGGFCFMEIWVFWMDDCYEIQFSSLRIKWALLLGWGCIFLSEWWILWWTWNARLVYPSLLFEMEFAMKWTLTDMTRVSVMSFPSKHDATHQSRFVLHSKKPILILNWTVYTKCTRRKTWEWFTRTSGHRLFSFIHRRWVCADPCLWSWLHNMSACCSRWSLLSILMCRTENKNHIEQLSWYRYSYCISSQSKLAISVKAWCWWTIDTMAKALFGGASTLVLNPNPSHLQSTDPFQVYCSVQFISSPKHTGASHSLSMPRQKFD